MNYQDKPIHPTSEEVHSANFGSSGVRGMLRGLVEMIAEIFRPLPRQAYLPRFYAFFIVGSVPEFPELRACLMRAITQLNTDIVGGGAS
jgi:hypothetical protein